MARAYQTEQLPYALAVEVEGRRIRTVRLDADDVPPSVTSYSARYRFAKAKAERACRGWNASDQFPDRTVTYRPIYA